MSLVELQKATVHVLVKLGFVFPSKPFIEAFCDQFVAENLEVFEELAKT